MNTDVMTVSEVAEYLRVNPQTVYRRAKAGQLPAVRIGRAIRFRKSELDEWMKTAAVISSPEGARDLAFKEGISRPSASK